MNELQYRIQRLIDVIEGPVMDRLTGDDCAETGLYSALNEVKQGLPDPIYRS